MSHQLEFSFKESLHTLAKQKSKIRFTNAQKAALGWHQLSNQCLCADYSKELNTRAHKDAYPLPLVYMKSRIAFLVQ